MSSNQETRARLYQWMLVCLVSWTSLGFFATIFLFPTSLMMYIFFGMLLAFIAHKTESKSISKKQTNIFLSIISIVAGIIAVFQFDRSQQFLTITLGGLVGFTANIMMIGLQKCMISHKPNMFVNLINDDLMETEILHKWTASIGALFLVVLFFMPWWHYPTISGYIPNENLLIDWFKHIKFLFNSEYPIRTRFLATTGIPIILFLISAMLISIAGVFKFFVFNRKYISKIAISNLVILFIYFFGYSLSDKFGTIDSTISALSISIWVILLLLSITDYRKRRLFWGWLVSFLVFKQMISLL